LFHAWDAREGALRHAEVGGEQRSGVAAISGSGIRPSVRTAVFGGDGVYQSGAPRSMKMGTIASPWRYDAARQNYAAACVHSQIILAFTTAAGSNREILASPRAPGSSNVSLGKRSGRSTMTEHPRISLAPGVLAGKPVIRGTRLSVEFVIGLMADGWSEADILGNYPGVTHEDIIACLAYARDTLSSEKVFPSAA
jgi:uncharacterized protein (DUF433 family)